MEALNVFSSEVYLSLIRQTGRTSVREQCASWEVSTNYLLYQYYFLLCERNILSNTESLGFPITTGSPSKYLSLSRLTQGQSAVRSEPSGVQAEIFLMYCAEMCLHYMLPTTACVF